MKMTSHYGNLGVNLLCGKVEHSQPDTQVASYGRNSALPERNAHSLTASPSTMRLGGHQHIQKHFTNTQGVSRNAEQISNQNTPQKTCTELAADIHFTSFSKNVFRRRQVTNFRGYQADIFAPPKQESGAKNGNSVHGRFLKMPSQQDDQFSYRAGSVGKCTTSDFWFFIRLLLTQLTIRNTTTEFDCSVQG